MSEVMHPRHANLVDRALTDVLSFIVDNRGRTCPVTDSGFPLIATNCIKPAHREAVFENVRYVDDETYARWFRAHPLPGDVIFVCKGSPGRVAVVPDPVPYCIAQDMVALRADTKVIDPTYLYYRLSAPDVQAKIQNMHVGTLIPHFKKGDFAQLRFSVHENLDEQRRIAGVLGALDDLIEVDSALIRNLWSAAGFAFADAARLAELVPARDCIELQYGKGLPTVLRRPGPVQVVSSAGIIGTHDEALVKGPGVVVGRKGSVGTVTWVDGDFFPIDTAFYVVSQLPKLYCYLALRLMGLEYMNTDSAVPGLNRENALSRPFPRPTKEALYRFVTVTQPLIAAVAGLKHESVELARARDELLPVLLNGRVQVGDVAA